jgi:hypothetical protein
MAIEVAFTPSATRLAAVRLAQVAVPEPEASGGVAEAALTKDPVPLLPADAVLEPDGATRAPVTVPMLFPVLGKSSWSDTFLAARDGGKRRHMGQDVIAPKLAPLVAAFDGLVSYRLPQAGGHCMLRLTGEAGWGCSYLHMNNDRPGTDDGLGGVEFAFAPGLRPGSRVVAGQLLGWVGDSGNAEGTVPHLHLELWQQGGPTVNAAPSLRAATKVAAPKLVQGWPELRPAKGEVRLDGFVRQVDRARGVLVLGLRSRTENGRAVAVSQPERGWVKWPATPELRLLGDEATRLPLADVTDGMAVVVLGSQTGGSVTARVAYVEAPGLVMAPQVVAKEALGPGAPGGT